MAKLSYALTITRRFIPWLLVNFILLPLSWVLIYIGFGKKVAAEFREEMM